MSVLRHAALLLAAVLLLPGCGGGASDEGGEESSWTPSSSDLVFTSNRSGNGEIYLLPAGGTDWINLTNDPAEDNWPVWSPDGSRIAFQSDRSGNLDVFVMNAGGGSVVQLTGDPAPDYLPAWSPDGSRLTFASWRTEEGEAEESVHIYVVNADGSGVRRLFEESPGNSTAPAWRPDGRGFVMSRKEPGKSGNLFLLGEDGSVLRRLTDDARFNGAPVFSPDGERIAFYLDLGDISRIEVINADGTGRRTVVGAGRNWYPHWSEDGRWLAYSAAVPGSDGKNLDVMAVPASGEGTPLLLAGGPTWEAEGSWRPGPR